MEFVKFLLATVLGVVLGLALGIRAASRVAACEVGFARAAAACGATDDVDECRSRAAEAYVACEGAQ